MEMKGRLLLFLCMVWIPSLISSVSGGIKIDSIHFLFFFSPTTELSPENLLLILPSPSLFPLLPPTKQTRKASLSNFDSSLPLIDSHNSTPMH